MIKSQRDVSSEGDFWYAFLDKYLQTRGWL